MEDFKVIKRRRLYQDVVGQIHDLIRDGTLKPGDRLPPERELAEQFEVSRSSIREAMRALELQGLVASRPGSGTFVSTDSLESLVAIIASSLGGAREYLDDIFEVRRLLEPQIAALAAERATEADINRIAEALEHQEQQIARGETGAEGDTSFHFGMAQATHNWAIVKVMSTIADILLQSRDLSLQAPGRPQRSLASHRQILDMVRRRDVEGARPAMEQHISEVEPAQFPASKGTDSARAAPIGLQS